MTDPNEVTLEEKDDAKLVCLVEPSLTLSWSKPDASPALPESEIERLAKFVGKYDAVPGKQANGKPVYRKAEHWLSCTGNNNWIIGTREDEVGQNRGYVSGRIEGDCHSGHAGPSWDKAWPKVPGMQLWRPTA